MFTYLPPLAGLVFGASTEELLDNHIGAYLPQLLDQPLTDLFVPGAIGPAPALSGMRRAEAPQKRGLLKKESDNPANQRAGPLQTMRLRHLIDQDGLEVSVQAVRKTAGNGLFLLLHPVAPCAGSPQFW